MNYYSNSNRVCKWKKNTLITFSHRRDWRRELCSMWYSSRSCRTIAPG